MNVAVVGGQCDSKSFVIATHVAILARHKFPLFQYKTHPVEKEDFEKWLVNLCGKEQWSLEELQKERVVCWYEVRAPGGPKRLLGGLYAFLEYMSDNYGVERQLTLEQVDTIVRLKQQQMKHDSDYDRIMKKLKTTFTVSIIGAGSNPAVTMIMYALLRLKGRPLQDGVYVRLYDKHQGKFEAMKKIKKYFNAMENNMGYGFITIFKDFKELVEDCDILIFLGENFRTHGMDIEKFLFKERVLYVVYGTLCSRYVKHRTRIVFCCMENSCFNATVFMERAPTLHLGSVVAMTSHLGGEVKVYISKVSGFPIENIVDVPVWGMVDVSHMVDVSKARLLFRYPNMKGDFFPRYESYREKCGISSKVLVAKLEEMRDVATLKEKQAEKESRRGERLLLKEMQDKRTSTLLDFAKQLRRAAAKGDEVKEVLDRVQQDLLDLIEDEDISMNAFIDGAIGIYNKCGSSVTETDLRQLLEDELNKFFHNHLVRSKEREESGEEHQEEYPDSISRKNISYDEQQFFPKSHLESYFEGRDSIQGQKVTPEEFKANCYNYAEDLEALEKEEDMKMEEQSSECSEEEDEKYEMRKLGYISNSLKNMWHYVGIAKALVRRKTGRDPFMGQVSELMNLLKIWFLDPCRRNEVIFLGVVSDGSYSLPKGYVMSQPATMDGNLCWQPYPYGEHAYPTEGEDSCYNPHRDSPTKGPLKYPELCTLSSAVNIARMCLKHFSVSPELETDEDIVERRLQEKEIIDWRLGVMKAEYEYRELKKFDSDCVPIQEVLPEMYQDEMEEEGTVIPSQKKIDSIVVTESEGTVINQQSFTEMKEPEQISEERNLEMKPDELIVPKENEEYENTETYEVDQSFEKMISTENYYEETLFYEESKETESDERVDSEGRDIKHKKYLEGLGFYAFSSDEDYEDEDGLEPEYQKLMKTAFKEYFGLECDEEEGKERRQHEKEVKECRNSNKHQNWPVQFENVSLHEDQDYGAEEVFEEESSKVGIPESLSSKQTISCQGIGMNILIEEELGNPNFISSLEAEVLPDNFPQFDKEHEYEKSYSKKPGFPLDFQGKSTIDIYKTLLKVDPALLREKFEALARKIDALYEEEIGKGNIIEEEDGTIIVNESTNCAEESEDKSKSSTRIMNRYDNGMSGIEEESYRQEVSLNGSGSFGGLDREESSDSMSDVKQRHSLPPINASNLQAGSGCVLTEKKIVNDYLSRGISKLEKAYELGILTTPAKEVHSPLSNYGQGDNCGNNLPVDVDLIKLKYFEQKGNSPYYEMTKEEEEKLVHYREKMWAEYKEKLEVNNFELEDGSSVKIQDFENEILQTEDQIKAKCGNFIEFVTLSRDHAWMTAEYRGDTRPMWHFRSKKKGERYQDFKVKSLTCGMALRKLLLMKRNEAYCSHNHEFFGSSEDEDIS